MFGLLMILYFLIHPMEGYSQDIGAAYWFKKGIIEKDQDKKIEYYQKAVQEDPKFVEAHYNLALIFLLKKELNNAENAFKSALAANPNAPLKTNILSRLGLTYRKLNRYTEAEDALQEVINITNDNKLKALTLYELGQTKISQGQFDAAVNYFQQGIRTLPEDRSPFETGIQLARDQQKINDLFQQGIMLVKNDKLLEAKEIFNQIINLNPNHNEAKQQIENIALMEQQIELENQQLQPLYNQAVAYMNEGEWSEAIKNFGKIKSLQADFADVDKLLTLAQEQQHQQLLAVQKTDSFYAMGIENFEKGNYIVALANFERVFEQNPTYKDIEPRIVATKKEVKRVNELMSKMPGRDIVNFIETNNSFEIESNPTATTAPSSQQLFSEQSRQLNTAVDSQLVQNYYHEALDFMQKQEWQRAMILLEKIRLLKPNYQNTEFLISQVKHNIETANIGIVNKTGDQKKSPTVLFALLLGIIALPAILLFASPTTRAKYFILLKKYDKAQEIYERMLSKKPNNVKLYITLANIYINENRVDEIAIQVFERAIQYNDQLKIQLEPIVSKYYLQKSKSSDTPRKLIQGALYEELKRMGK